MRPSESALNAGVAFAFGVSLFSIVGAVARLVPATWVRPMTPTARRAGANLPLATKPRRRTVVGSVARYSIACLLLWALYLGSAWTRASVGFARRDSVVVSAIAGVMIYYALSGLYGLALHWFGRRDSERQAALRISFGMLPNRPRARCAVIATLCLVNPIVEELIFRGLLVHQYAALSGNLPKALLIGAVVNATNHAYQGLRMVPFHLVFYAATVSLMYSPYGLAAAIGLHYAADAVPLLGLQEQLKEYREKRRKARRAHTVPA